MPRLRLLLPETLASWHHPIGMSSLAAAQTMSTAHALQQLLNDLAMVIGSIPAETYRDRFAAPHSGSIGEHVRHCLDHIACLLTADGSETLSYDHRERGTAVEIDPAAAVRQMRRFQRALDTWSRRSLDQPIRVACMLSPDGDGVAGWSTLARELAFVVSHTIHHQAMIGLLLASRGHSVPTRFGRAPSTPAVRH
jgi:uncharacterized damage-inducible protein DinB